ncbi:MAG TPA: cadmium resistance transporter [Nostocaceae cyanobacterium]|nr:cadmium resistance transporter [Nostocaceae cyanobacterium]
MYDLLSTLSTGLVAFTATNIDDIIILLLFFSQINSTFSTWQIVIGQYLGFAAIIILSLPGFFGGFILPPELLGLLGLIPITIGMNSLVNQGEDAEIKTTSKTTATEIEVVNSWLNPQVYAVAAVTIANSSDNISVYVPLFANSQLSEFLEIISVFCLLVAVWCYAAYKLTNQQAIANILTRYGNQFIPFALIGLGALMIWKSGAMSPIKLVASCICLLVLVKQDDEND